MLGLRLSARIGLHMDPIFSSIWSLICIWSSIWSPIWSIHMDACMHASIWMLHMGLHMELHMHMRLHMELNMGSIWRPIRADRRSPSMLISLHQNKIETAIYIYIYTSPDLASLHQENTQITKRHKHVHTKSLKTENIYISLDH